jgi:hypothetical protein
MLFRRLRTSFGQNNHLQKCAGSQLRLFEARPSGAPYTLVTTVPQTGDRAMQQPDKRTVVVAHGGPFLPAGLARHWRDRVVIFTERDSEASMSVE